VKNTFLKYTKGLKVHIVVIIYTIILSVSQILITLKFTKLIKLYIKGTFGLFD